MDAEPPDPLLEGSNDPFGAFEAKGWNDVDDGRGVLGVHHGVVVAVADDRGSAGRDVAVGVGFGAEDPDVGQRVWHWAASPVDGQRPVVRGDVGHPGLSDRGPGPEAKGVIERANGFLATSFMPGRSFTSPADYNTQLTDRLPMANSRLLRRNGEQPGIRIAEDRLGMGMLPPVPPVVGTSTRVRLGRDYYVRIGGND